MSTTESKSNDTIQIGPLRIENFTDLLRDLQTSVNQFQSDSTPENFAAIVTNLRSFGLSGADVWQQAAGYARKNPLRCAAFAGLAFYAIKGLLSATPSTRKLVH